MPVVINKDNIPIHLTMKRILFILLLFSVSLGYAQNYPKYKTKRVKDTIFKQPEKITDAKEVRKEPPADFMALYEKARDFARNKKYEEAIVVFTEALAIAPPDWESSVLFFRGNSYSLLKNFDEAIKDFTNALENTDFPNDNARGNAHLMRGLAYSARGDEVDEERKCADFKKAREYGALSGDKAIDANCD